MSDPQMPMDTRSRGYEETHFSLNTVLWFIGIFVGCMVSFNIGLYFVQAWLMEWEANADRPMLVFTEQPIPPEPRLQSSRGHSSNDWQDWQAMRQMQERKLNSQGPIPGDPGFVHIPIDRAMELFIQRQPTTMPATGAGGSP